MYLKFLISVLIINGVVLSQTIPLQYQLSNKNKAGKVTADVQRSNTIEDILIDENNTIWLATSRGLSKSEDGGNTWTNYYGTEAFGTESVSKVGYHNGVIWAGTWHYETPYDNPEIAGTGLRYSSDNGDTWNIVEHPLDEPGDSVIYYGNNRLNALPVTVNIQNIVYDIDFTGNTVWIALFAGGVRKSTDMGESWERVVLPPDYLNEIHPDDTLDFDLSVKTGELGLEENENHKGFSIEAVNDSVIYVGTAGGINKSTDGGISWRKFNHQNQDQPISGNFIVSLDYDYVTENVWAATWKANDLEEFYAVSSSSDGGETWQTHLPNSRTHAFGFMGIGNGNSHILAATEDGLYRSSNNGNTWIVNPLIIDNRTGYKITTNHFRAVGSQEVDDNSTNIWVGSLNGLAKLNEPINGFWNGEWTVYISSPKTKEENIETFAFPNPFSPDDENVRIQYSTGGETNDVTIRIFDFGMNLVRTIIQNAPRSGMQNDHQDIWDGRDENGSIVPNGVYFYRIDIGSNEPIYGKIMVLM